MHSQLIEDGSQRDHHDSGYQIPDELHADEIRDDVPKERPDVLKYAPGRLAERPAGFLSLLDEAGRFFAGNFLDQDRERVIVRNGSPLITLVL